MRNSASRECEAVRPSLRLPAGLPPRSGPVAAVSERRRFDTLCPGKLSPGLPWRSPRPRLSGPDQGKDKQLARPRAQLACACLERDTLEYKSVAPPALSLSNWPALSLSNGPFLTQAKESESGLLIPPAHQLTARLTKRQSLRTWEQLSPLPSLKPWRTSARTAE